MLAKKLRETFMRAGKHAEFIIYPPYGRNGHRMFFEVGGYWKDVEQFLETHLQPERQVSSWVAQGR